MKKFLGFILSALIVTGYFSFIETVPVTAAAMEKTVLDYYLQLPDEYFQCETENILKQKDKLSRIKKKDLKKGYIHATTMDGNIPIETVLFTDEYMGISVFAVNVRCSAGCMCRRLDFFFVNDGRIMKNDGDGLFPSSEEIEKAAGVSDGYEFVLPEDGKGINIADEESGKILLRIKWSGGTFNIE